MCAQKLSHTPCRAPLRDVLNRFGVYHLAMVKVPVTAPQAADVILFYDGTCGFCSRIVQFILKHERAGRSLRFGRLQGAAAQALRERYPWLSDVDSVIWYEPGGAERSERVLVRSDAGLAAAEYLGGVWRVLALLGRLAPRVIRDAVYNCVARSRQRLGYNAACLLPSGEQRVRFID